MDHLATTIIQQIFDNLGKHNSKLPISETDICSIFGSAKDHAATQPSILTLNGNFTIVGDIHGSLTSLVHIFDENGFPDTHRYIFLGDYVDRGPCGLEVLLLLFSFQILYPEHVFLLRGNHESPSMTAVYGFRDECFSRDVPCAYYAALAVFDEFPLAAILNDNVFCVHGGISSQIHDLESLYALPKAKLFFPERYRCRNFLSQKQQKYQNFCQKSEISENFDSSEIDDWENISSAVLDFLWSDPSNTVQGYEPSPRGCGCLFGQDAVEQFLANINCALVVRSHESCQNGYKYTFPDRRILTVFSSVDYCGLSNLGAYLVFNEKGAQLKQLMPLQREKKRWILPEAVLDLIAQIPTTIDA